jgi:hypothetical protein
MRHHQVCTCLCGVAQDECAGDVQELRSSGASQVAGATCILGDGNAPAGFHVVVQAFVASCLHQLACGEGGPG